MTQCLTAANLLECRKVTDTRRPPRQQPAVSKGTTGNGPSFELSDNDSHPDVHWCKALLCYYSCWSHGTLRMPPRWRLERIDQLDQIRATSSTPGQAHASSQLMVHSSTLVGVILFTAGVPNSMMLHQLIHM